ncbi:hypothetical protein [Rhizobium leguminosarum]|uniref:Uncharacterized protein n=1 Tax=Rhizobium leguminosarum TaxID=384 RepID=A0A1B1CHQ6_RHILE|nr:hypothetical protein [Rhizobium leguminosarum]ANP89284.1 hypothetical protein BA011_26255 [Rhizobium leguminosarum]NKL25034.1 hypothetical protein [Rhizobium leguminosarum bv. viciae]
MSRMKKISGFVLLFSAFSCSYASETLADVATHQALTLYGNATLSGLCRHLGINRQMVCQLSDIPDVSLAFNDAAPLHIEVRTPTCEGNSVLDGEWPYNLKIAADQPETVCTVEIKDYVDRLNAQPEIIGCEDSFQDAFFINKINARTAYIYIQQCKLNPDEDQSE